MGKMGETKSSAISRRELLKRAGLAGAVAAVPVEMFAKAEAMGQGVAPIKSDALETLTRPESRTLEAIVRRIIPSDESGPGAAEAQAARYIDRALGGPLASSREAYSSGLAAIDAYARTSKGSAFAELSAADQDAVLMDLDRDLAPGFVLGSAAFFALVRAHTIQGTFCDPLYGGNANFVGWDLIGYPGVRTAVTADQQQTAAVLKPNHRSAYDFDMFKGNGPTGRPQGRQRDR
jgi:gluconate 2-dehydrogenase gamma chain